MTPGDSEAGTVSVSVTGVVAVVVSSREELMKEVVLEAEGLVVMGVWASCSPSGPSPSPSGSLHDPERPKMIQNFWIISWFLTGLRNQNQERKL